ncbi:CHAP domain-containing protein [Marinobacter nauticus]|uniref:Phage peptidoglycan hydrolase n=1 Tax=Marinobacter nauticus TaxID=2743 RepID=A0A833JPF8_MARNT|nr:CHAP domain-containing protein [Marinobacter nauticus]KAE8545338.1 Phage peptidoglycan hydrolase [Marinobacter nauticus]
MTLNDLLNVPYLANGRQPDGADCYGLTRLARVHLFGKPWMPEHGAVEGSDKRALTKAMLKESVNYRICEPRPGAIACCYRGRLCTHIAIVVEVDGRLMILETDEPSTFMFEAHGPRLVNLKHLERRFLKVVYYDD